MSYFLTIVPPTSIMLIKIYFVPANAKILCESGPEEALIISFISETSTGIIASPNDLSSTCSVKLTDLPVSSDSETFGNLIEFRLESTASDTNINRFIRVTNSPTGEKIQLESYPQIFKNGGYQLIDHSEELLLKYEGNQTTAFTIYYSGNTIIFVLSLL